MRYIFLAIVMGLIGIQCWIRERGTAGTAGLQTVWLLLLIFCMGVSIGRNGEVVRSLPLLGGKAVLFAVMTAIGSIAVVYILSTLFLEKEGKK